VDKIKKCFLYCIKSAIDGFKEAFPHIFSPRKSEDFDAYVKSLRKNGDCKPGGGCC